MPDPTADFDMQVLSDLNTRTLVNGAAIDTNLIAAAVGISVFQLRDCLSRLQQRGFIRLDSIDLAGLTPLGHEHLTRAIAAPSDDVTGL